MALVGRQSLVAKSQGGKCRAHTPSRPSRRVQRRGRLTVVFLRLAGALSLGGTTTFGTPLGGLGQNLIQGR